MNFYKRFIGDIQAKTGGLTLAEFGAYDRLLDHYYSTEKPVPADETYRICRAMSASERTAVDKVLSKFFELDGEGWVQSKAEEVIAKALPLIEAARANGKKGGRPRKPKTQEEPSGLPKDNPDGTQQKPSLKATQSQSQISTSDEVEKPRKRGANQRADTVTEIEGVPPDLLADYLEVRRAKSAGALTGTALAGIERAAGEAGLSTPDAIRVCAEQGWVGFKASWYANLQPSQRHPRNAAPAKYAAAARTIFGDTPETFDAETH